jgi:hypothetical protein
MLFWNGYGTHLPRKRTYEIRYFILIIWELFSLADRVLI